MGSFSSTIFNTNLGQPSFLAGLWARKLDLQGPVGRLSQVEQQAHNG